MFRVWVFDSQTTPGTTDSGSGGNRRQRSLIEISNTGLATFVAIFGCVVLFMRLVLSRVARDICVVVRSAIARFSRFTDFDFPLDCNRSLRSARSSRCVRISRCAVQVSVATDRICGLPSRAGCLPLFQVRDCRAVSAATRPWFRSSWYRLDVSRLNSIPDMFGFKNSARRICSVPSSATFETAIAG